VYSNVYHPPAQRSVAKVVLFTVVSVCDFVCLSVYLSVSVNTVTPEPLAISSRNFREIILGPKGRQKFENGYCEMHEWLENAPKGAITSKIKHAIKLAIKLKT